MIRQLRFSRNTKGERVGFTLLELLIVIAILSLLAALFLPAVMNVRASARRVQCSNKMRQIALALFQSEETLGRLPASGNFETSGPKQYHSWVTTILSELEQGNLRQQYRFDLPVDDPANAGLIHTPIAVLVCPEDISVSAGKGNLTYVVNGGFGWTIPVDCPASIRSDPTTTTIAPLDLNGNGVVCPFDPRDDATSGDQSDLEYLRRTSVFFVENWPSGEGTRRSHEIEDIRDGTSQTLLLSENLRAGHDPGQDTSWASPDPRYNSFFISGRICLDQRCSPGNVDLALANDRSDGNLECINCSLDQPEGTAPWLSSLHVGTVNAAFCDGHVSSVSEVIDGKVFAALATPQGTLNRGPLAEPLVSGSF